MADLMDSFPFQDEMVVLEMSGDQILEVLEQSLTLERGMLQVSGLFVRYDMNQTIGNRVLDVTVLGRELDSNAVYKVATIEIVAQGADLFSTFAKNTGSCSSGN